MGKKSRLNHYLILQKHYNNKVPASKISRVNDILDLYKSGHIHNVKTAMNQVQNVLKLSNSQADTLKFYKNLVNFMSKTPAKQKNQQKKEERRKNKFEKITKQPLEYYTLNVLIFRNDNNRPGKPDFERDGNKFWLVGNYKEDRARRDYIDIEVFGPNPFPNELSKDA